MKKFFVLIAGLLCVLNVLSAEYVKTVHGYWALEEYGVSVKAEASLDDSLEFDVIYDFTGDAMKPFIEDFSIVFLDADGFKTDLFASWRLIESETEETADGVRHKASYEIGVFDSNRSRHLALEFPYCVDSLRLIPPRQLVEAYQAQIDIEQNNLMKIFTVITAIFLPLTLMVGWYGMNFKYMYELDSVYRYPVFIICSIIVCIVLIIYFKKRHWF